MSGAFWALDKGLAQQRHFPAINWSQSYTLYDGMLAPWFRENLGEEWFALRDYLKDLLEREQSLLELVQLVGRDGLSEEDKWTLFMAELARVLFLQQNAFVPEDASFAPELQKLYLLQLRECDRIVREALSRGVLFDQAAALPLRSDLLALRSLGKDEMTGRGAKWRNRRKAELEAIAVMPQ
jgi:V/A-type H+-transporting ATPase subunit A